MWNILDGLSFFYTHEKHSVLISWNISEYVSLYNVLYKSTFLVALMVKCVEIFKKDISISFHRKLGAQLENITTFLHIYS